MFTRGYTSQSILWHFKVFSIAGRPSCHRHSLPGISRRESPIRSHRFSHDSSIGPWPSWHILTWHIRIFRMKNHKNEVRNVIYPNNNCSRKIIEPFHCALWQPISEPWRFAASRFFGLLLLPVAEFLHRFGLLLFLILLLFAIIVTTQPGQKTTKKNLEHLGTWIQSPVSQL